MELSEEDKAAVELHFQLLKAKYGARLNQEAEAELRERLAEVRQRISAIRQVPLTLDDEPLLHFSPRPSGRNA